MFSQTESFSSHGLKMCADISIQAIAELRATHVFHINDGG